MTNNESTPLYDNAGKPDPIVGPLTDDVETVIHPSAKPQPKVVAATVGAGVGSAVGEILVWIVEASANIDVPSNVEFAIGVVFTAGLAFVAGYRKRN